VSDVRAAVDALIAEHGLKAVYEAVRLDRDGFCGNCGCPLDDGAPHQAAGIGWCYSGVAS
jgi:hypothetical protein